MITQTLALFLDSYRELNAKKLFWITLMLSAVCMAAFALLGVSDHGLKLLNLEFAVPMPQVLYNTIFSFFVVGVWLSWGSVLLALVSTAGIFPDLIAGGAIDLYLSKPIGRFRLFLTKYLAGLVFVLLQSFVFTAAAYFVLGIRAHRWLPSLWLLVPLVVCLFSYLFSICVLLGVITRSTVAAILITVLMWLFLFMAAKAENVVLSGRVVAEREAQAYRRRVEALEKEIADLRTSDSITNTFGVRSALLRQRAEKAKESAEQAASTAGKFKTAHRIALGVLTVLPKPGPTIDLIDRHLFSDDMLSGEQQADAPVFVGPDSDPDERAAMNESFREARRDVQLQLRTRSPVWIIGTSLAFEAVVLLVAGWVFVRRDY